MSEHTPQWKRGFAQCIAGVPFSDKEPADWQDGHNKALDAMLSGRIPDRHGAAIQAERAAKAKWHSFINNEPVSA